MIYDRFEPRKANAEQDVFLFAIGELGGWRKAWLAVRAVFDRRLQYRLAVVADLGARVEASVRPTAIRQAAPYLRTVTRAKWALAICLCASACAFLAYRIAGSGDTCPPTRVQTMSATPPGTDRAPAVTLENCLENSEVVSE